VALIDDMHASARPGTGAAASHTAESSHGVTIVANFSEARVRALHRVTVAPILATSGRASSALRSCRIGSTTRTRSERTAEVEVERFSTMNAT
jgi:hypothetical protein